jgi:ATP-dependent RNA helicase RhlE
LECLHSACALGAPFVVRRDTTPFIEKEQKYMKDFEGLQLAQPLLRAIRNEGYTTPTPIQAKSIPPMAEGRDLLGVAQTGTGKTASFALPLLHRLADDTRKTQSRRPRALILAPTRELAGQICDSLRTYGRHLHLRSTAVFGGASIRPQIKAMGHGVHVLVATPGRLLDLMNQGHVRLDRVEIFVLDEADRMLDMGFIHDVKKISARIPEKRQTALFSATMPKNVKALADGLLNDPVRVEVTPAATTVEKIEQKVLFVPKDKKRALLSELLNDNEIKRVLIFTRTKHGADRVSKHLYQNGVKSDAIHGNKAQNARQRALKDFKSGRIRALVATDIAARGIDVDDVTHVINFDLPNEPESYVHRIGRTARAGAGGIAISFCDHEERTYLRDIEKTIRQDVPVVEDHPFHSNEIANDPGPSRRPQKKRQGQRRRNVQRGRRPSRKAA